MSARLRLVADGDVPLDVAPPVRWQTPLRLFRYHWSYYGPDGALIRTSHVYEVRDEWCGDAAAACRHLEDELLRIVRPGCRVTVAGGYVWRGPS